MTYRKRIQVLVDSNESVLDRLHSFQTLAREILAARYEKRSLEVGVKNVSEFFLSYAEPFSYLEHVERRFDFSDWSDLCEKALHLVPAILSFEKENWESIAEVKIFISEMHERKLALILRADRIDGCRSRAVRGTAVVTRPLAVPEGPQLGITG